jgi:tetratricopeptide (TPR) repeat protein
VAGSALPESAEERGEVYRDKLAGRRVLILLDDALDERQVLPLLPGTGSCAVLVTSRFRLTGLASAHQVDLDVLTEDQAVRMLANVIGPERVNAEPEASLALVNLCGYLPLAIRIGAARLAARPHWAISQLTSRLLDERRRLDELVHRGLGVRPSIAVAYESLTPPARRLFSCLSILETPDFAGWVAAPLLDVDLVEAEDLLESIVDVRLLDAEQSAGKTRYRFHDLIRVYARERLFLEQPPEDRRAALHRMIGAWLFVAGQAHQRQYGGDYTVLHSNQPRWKLPAPVVQQLVAEPLEWLDSERSGLVIAVRQAGEAGFDELCWDLAMTTVTLFEARSYLDDWRDTHEVALAATRRAGNQRGEAAMLYSLGALNLVEQRFSEATERLRTALTTFEELGDAHGWALALRHLAYIERLNGNYDSSLAKYQEAVAGLRTIGDRVGEAHVLGSIAQIRLARQEYDAAEDLLARALEIARSIGSTRTEAQLLHHLGEARRARGDLAGADQAFRMVLRLAQGYGDAVGEAFALYGLGNVQLEQERLSEAGNTLGRALLLAEESGEQLLRARICLALGELSRAAKQYDEATERLLTALDLFERMGALLWQARALVLLGKVYRSVGRAEAAAASFTAADRLIEGMHGKPAPS